MEVLATFWLPPDLQSMPLLVAETLCLCGCLFLGFLMLLQTLFPSVCSESPYTQAPRSSRLFSPPTLFHCSRLAWLRCGGLILAHSAVLSASTQHTAGPMTDCGAVGARSARGSRRHPRHSARTCSPRSVGGPFTACRIHTRKNPATPKGLVGNSCPECDWRVLT